MNNLTWHHCSFGSTPFRARNGLVEASVFQQIATESYVSNIYYVKPNSNVTQMFTLASFIRRSSWDTLTEAIAYAEEQLNAY